MTAPSLGIAARYVTAAAPAFGAVDAICNFATRQLDTHNAVVVGANWAFVAPATGVYSLSSLVVWSGVAWAPTNFAHMRYTIDGAVGSVLAFLMGYNTGASTPSLALSGCDPAVYLRKGQALSVTLAQSAAASLALYNDALYNWISIKLERA